VTTTITDETPETVRAQVIAWRRYLHQHPELSFHEHETSRFIAETLASFGGLEISRPTPTSVMARLIGGAGPGPVLAIRADIDALPIVEANTHEFVSTAPGVMHACGHDGHTSMLLGAVKILLAQRGALRGEVRFLFQHAEELYPGGASQMVEAGALDGVATVIGAHLWLGMPFGRVGVRAGPLMASLNTFRLTITGAGGHAAMPQQTIDPIVTAAEVVTSLQHVVSRNVDPLAPAVISVTQINGGTTTNVIPGTVEMAGTVRTFDATLRERIPVLMERVAAGICEAHGAAYTWTFEPGYAAVNNDAAACDLVRRAVRRALGPEALVEATPTMGAEDFSAYQQQTPGAFFFVGARNEERGIVHPHHHERFDLDERALDYGTRVFVAAVLEQLGDGHAR
jgi:amidohydrolase